jgi:hypothetical protein
MSFGGYRGLVAERERDTINPPEKAGALGDESVRGDWSLPVTVVLDESGI